MTPSPLWQFSLNALHTLIWFGSLFLVLGFAVRYLTTRQLALLTTSMTFVLVVFGAYVRLSNAGLGCPDWPGCYGTLSPSYAKTAIAHAMSAAPDGPVSTSKAWKEMLHRYVASLVGALIVSIVLRAWLNRQRSKTHLFGSALISTRLCLPLLALGLVIVQGLFGKWTVTFKLYPIVVTTHLLGGMSLLALLVLYVLQQYKISAIPAQLRTYAALGLAVLVVQIALGGWVSTNNAAPACGELPGCQGALLPDTDFSQGFQLSRELGMTAQGTPLPLPALTAIHLTHRAFAIVVVVMLGLLAWRLWRAGVGGWGTALGITLIAQVCLGLAIVYVMSSSHLQLTWQLPLAAAHNAGAALLLVGLTVLNYRAWSRT